MPEDTNRKKEPGPGNIVAEERREAPDREYWDRHASRDPLWAILSDPARSDRRWDLASFMERGERDVALFLGHLESLGVSPDSSWRVLDFGCGVGRTARIAALMALLRPGGVFAFQMPAGPAPPHAAPTAMRDEAYRARLTSASPMARSAEAGTDLDVVIRVVNESAVTWDPDAVGAIRIGNHWLTASGRMIVQDDGRCSLPFALAPGAGCDLVLTVRAPGDCGDYVLEVDAVHEGVTWFADRGSPSWRAPVVVSAPGGDAESSNRDPVTNEGSAMAQLEMPDYSGVQFEPLLGPVPGSLEVAPFPMHGIPRDEVLDIVAANEGRVLGVIEDDRAKPEWTGYLYLVRAPIP